jgi:predicted PurR-regulated permease PerM
MHRQELSPTFKAWLTFAGCVLIVAVLSWAQVVLVPVALAALLTFVLAPPVTWLERWIGRVPAVLLTVIMVFSVLGLAGWGLTRQLDDLVADLPEYRVNIRTKIADLRGAGEESSVKKLQATIEDILVDLKSEQPRGRAPQPVVVQNNADGEVLALRWFRSLAGPLGTAGLVLTLLIFMLLERRDLQARFLRLFGRGHVKVTNEALDEVGARVSRQLLMQSLVSVIYGLIAGIGLYLLEVPYPWVWAALGAVLRFVPYVGPIVGAGVPILVSLAASDGWINALSVITLFLVLELFTNLVLETLLYAGAAGISPAALLLSVTFWTWLWGPLGLLIATPLTVCLVVIGKHVPGVEFLATILAEAPGDETDPLVEHVTAS